MDSSRDQTCLQRQNVFSAEFRDLQATAMSVDWTGQWILLAGRRHLALQRIDFGEDNSLRKYHRNSKYDVSAAEWAICENSQEYCAIATSQLIEVVTWSSGDPTLIYSLRAHTRLVTDIDWHSKEPHLLASCSIDTFTHLWDLRDPRKPTLSLSAVCMSGATQVGFNRVSGNLLATAHDGDLRIWDIRKGSCPIQYITAHLARIHGINWSHSRESCLATASQDGTIKYFDISNPRRSGNLITTSSPVWRARYTPIGNGLVSIIVPHLGRGENSLLLWSNVKQSDPICSFVGHTDVILDFAWRPNRENAQEIEFVTWSRDQTLRVWKIDESLLKLCNPPQPEFEDDGDHWNSSKLCNSNDLTLKTAIENAPCSLQQEFAVFNTNIPHIEVQILDAGKRYATFKVTVNNYIIVLQINFPLEYPSSNVCPEFRFCQGTTIDESLSLTLMKALKTYALQKSKKGKTFLEQSLRFLVSSFKRSTSGGDKSQLRLQSPRLEGALSGALHDACIPFPKTSGAKFNNIGILVTFFQPIHTKRISIRHQNTTPRALSALSGGYLGNVLGSQPVLYAHRDSNTSNFYIQDRLRKTTRSRNLRRTYASAVVNVYDASKALNLNKNLAVNYIINKMDIPGTCKHNMEIAMSAGRNELIQAWHLAEVVATSNTAKSYDSEMLFHQNPFKRSLLESLIMHFAKYGDVQTSVTLCCTFDTNYSDLDLAVNHKPANKSPISSPYYTIVPGETNHAWSLSTQLRQIRSNSWSECYDGLEWKLPFSDISRPFFSKTKKNLFDNLKKVFGEILYGWDLITIRAMILKQLSYPTEMPQCVEFVTECLLCNRVSRSTSCNFCRKALLYCTLCRLPVKGLANACLLCGHGGHTEHLDQWFKNHEICASGCGCFCLKETANVLKEIN